jgi:hypothetical protein
MAKDQNKCAAWFAKSAKSNVAEPTSPPGSEATTSRTIRARTISTIGKELNPSLEHLSARGLQEPKSFDDGE